MISVEEALKILAKHLPKWGDYEAPLSSVSGGETTETLMADRDYPPFHRVMMDGIAVSWKTYAEGQRSFIVAGVCAAGAPQVELKDPGSCFEVMTGAPLPVNSDLVIPYEDLKLENGVASLTTETLRSQLDFVHLKGSDAKFGDALLKKGALLNGPHWGIAASVGCGTVKVVKKPRINVISSGDELVPVDQTPLDHQIRRSNAYALKSSLALFGYTEVELSHLNDDVAAIEKHYRDNQGRFDLMIYSGGVSKESSIISPQRGKNWG